MILMIMFSNDSRRIVQKHSMSNIEVMYLQIFINAHLVDQEVVEVEVLIIIQCMVEHPIRLFLRYTNKTIHPKCFLYHVNIDFFLFFSLSLFSSPSRKIVFFYSHRNFFIARNQNKQTAFTKNQHANI
jgi:hypothetical protein